jgi:glutamate racemase
VKGSRRPIGVFDSGLGGLTVLKALSRRMPQEDLLYFGDTAHVPYGSKSPETVARYSIGVARFLERKGVKLLIVACNTASAVALASLRRSVKVPVLGVIEPGVDAAVQSTRGRAVGIIGTEATIVSGAYSRALRRRLPALAVHAAACPLFVPLVEEGWWAHRATTEAARHYLAPIKRAKVDTLILGCTHYPLLKRVIQGVMGPRVRLIDSADQTARQAEALLRGLKLRRADGRGRKSFFVSDDPARFLKLARRLLGVNVGRVELHRFD